MGERESYRFYPWTVFTERPFGGRWVSVDADGVRAGRAPEPAAGRPPLTVWCFGGSTMFGWGQADGETIASHLQEMLQSRFPERAVRVVNHGHSYWFSSMELNHFLALLRHRPAPDVAIFLDGLNDSRMFLEGRHLPFFTDVAEQAWEHERRRRYRPFDGPWLEAKPSFPWLRLAASLRSRLGLGGESAESAAAERPPSPVSVGDALGRYAVNRRSIQAVGERLGVEVHQFLQPIPGYGAYAATTHSLAPEIYEFYDRLLAESPEELVSVHDALHRLERPFVDQTHYSDLGCRRVAGAIADHLVERIEL